MSLGYKEVSMSRILKETGLSKGGFYHHFESKEDLFEEVSRQFFATLDSGEGYSPMQEKSFIENINDWLDYRQRSFEIFADTTGKDTGPLNPFLFMMQVIRYLPGGRQQAEIYMYRQKRQIESIIEIALQRNEIPADLISSKLADLMLSTFDGIQLQGLLLSQTFETLTREKQMARMIFEGVRRQVNH